MKIIFEHQGRKTTVLGNDYDTIVDKIRLLFPDQNHRSIQFYDPELTDYFEFTSYEQVIDQPNGLKMNFDMSNTMDFIIADPSSAPTLDENENNGKNTNVKKSTSSKRSRKKPVLEHDDKSNEPPSLPVYCDMIIQGLQSRESFPAIKREFLQQTSAHFIQQYPDGAARRVHHSFVMALIEKFPILNYLDKSVDGINGKTPYYTISHLLSRKKRNTKYLKTHPAPKRQRKSVLDSSSNNETTENTIVETTTQEDDDVPNLVIDFYEQNSSNGCSIEELLNESSVNKTLTLLPDPSEQSTVAPPPPIQTPTLSTNRRATISLVPPSTPTVINDPSISIKPVIIKSITTTNAPTTLIYHNGRMHSTSVSSQSVVAVHRAIKPRDTMKKQIQNENNNCTSVTTSISKEPENILKSSTIDNIEQSNSLKGGLEVWFPKLSKSEQNAYNKDVSRLRSIVKPKNKSTNHVSIGEIHALIRNSHTIRRRMLYQKQDIDFTMKVLEYQEIFHEEALILEYSLLKDRECTFEEVQDRARALLNGLIEKYSVGAQEQMSEADFLSMNMLCDDTGEHKLFFKNGLTDPHPVMGIILMSSSMKGFEKAFMFVRNLPYKMSVSIGGGGLHKVLALLLIMYKNLNDLPGHKLLRMLFDQCGMKKS